MGRFIYVIAATALAASVAGGILMAESEAPAEAGVREKNFFSFLRPLPQSDAVDIAGVRVVQEVAPDLQWRILFDRRLTLGADRPPDLVRMELEQELDGLGPEAAARAKAVLGKYLRYRQEMLPLQLQIDGPQTSAAAVRDIQDLRARIFTRLERDVWFQHDTAYENLLLARQEIAKDHALTDEERQQRLQQVEGSVPAQTRQVEELRNGVVRLAPAPSADGEDDVYRLIPSGVK